MRTISRTIAACVAACTISVIPTAATAASPAAERAESFQAGELRDARMPSAFTDGTDWGLTIDTIYMLAATDGRRPLLDRMGRVLANNAGEYTSATFADTTYVSSGATAKVLLAAKVLGRDVRDFGGVDYRKRLTRFIVPNGPDAGRLSDRNSDGSDFSNTLGQSLGVIGFARTGSAPQPVVDHLLEQQCQAGFFSLSMTTGKNCNQAGGNGSVDATALAVQALFAAEQQGEAQVPDRRIAKAVRWLASVQRANGSFGSDADIRTSNANSTGLAAQALADAGRMTAVQKARQWVASVQITRRNAEAADNVIGAIAYDRAALRTAQRDGVTDQTVRDQFRRATSQGAFALAPEPFRVLSAK